MCETQNLPDRLTSGLLDRLDCCARSWSLPSQTSPLAAHLHRRVCMAWHWNNQWDQWDQGWQGAGAGSSSASWQESWQGQESARWRSSSRPPRPSQAPYQPDRAEEEQHAPGPSTGGGLSPPLPSGIGDKLKQKHIGGISAGEGMWRLVLRNPSPWDSCRMVQWPSHLATIQSRNPAAQPATLSPRPAPRTSKHLPTSLPMTPRQVCPLIVHSGLEACPQPPGLQRRLSVATPMHFRSEVLERTIGPSRAAETKFEMKVSPNSVGRYLPRWPWQGRAEPRTLVVGGLPLCSDSGLADIN